MARPINRTAIELEITTIEHLIASLKDCCPLDGARLKHIKPAGTASRASRAKAYPRLLLPDGTSRNVPPEEVAAYQARIDAARELRRLTKSRDRLNARLQ